MGRWRICLWLVHREEGFSSLTISSISHGFSMQTLQQCHFNPFDEDFCCWLISAFKKIRIVYKTTPVLHDLFYKLLFYDCIWVGFLRSRTEFCKWNYAQYLSNESAATSSCLWLKWKSRIMYLRNIPANEDVMSSHNTALHSMFTAATRCWKLDRWCHLRHMPAIGTCFLASCFWLLFG